MDKPGEADGRPKAAPSDIEIGSSEFVIDAELLGELFDVPPSRVPELIRDREITSVCERGVGDDDGKFRLTFFYRNRRARLNTDGIGRVVRRSAVNFGDRPIPDALRRSR
jgi:hypothetical protein